MGGEGERVMGKFTGQDKRRREGCVHVAFLHGPSMESFVKVLDRHDDGLRSLLGCMESDSKC